MMEIYSTHINSPLGNIMLECNDEFITAIKFVEEDIPPADIHHPLLLQCKLQLEKYFSGELQHFDLPLQQPGTEFQQKTWTLLSRIPFGKTISYHQLSQQYGDVKAIRALASANGKNNIAIIVPCHRVIGSNGSLTGYAGGLWRKNWLLEHEMKTKQTSLFN